MATIAALFERIDLGRTAILLGLLVAVGIIVWELWRSNSKR
jgi:hypothetical protein